MAVVASASLPAKANDNVAADLPTPESMSDAPCSASSSSRVDRLTSAERSDSRTGDARHSSIDVVGDSHAESSTDAQRRADKNLKERHLVASIDDWWTRVVSLRNRLSNDVEASYASRWESLPVPSSADVASGRVEELPRLLDRYLPESHGVGDMVKHLSQLWTKALNSKDFAIVETRRYGPPEFDLVALRDIKHRQQIKGLSGRLFPVYYGEDEDYDTEDVGFNSRLVFGSTRRIGKGKKRKLQHVSKLGLGPLRLLNHSCMYNVAWLQSKPPGSQYPLPQMSVFASRDIKKGEVLYAFYNTSYFGEDNYACLCGHTEKHGQPPPDSSSEEDGSDEEETPTRKMSSVKRVFRKVSGGSVAASKARRAPSPEPVPEPDLRTVIDLTGFDDDDDDDGAPPRKKPKYREYIYMGHTGIDLTLVDGGDDSDGEEADDALARKDYEEASLLELQGYEETGSRMVAPKKPWIKAEVKQEPADTSPTQSIRRAAEVSALSSPLAPVPGRHTESGSQTPRAASKAPAGCIAGRQVASSKERSVSKERDDSASSSVHLDNDDDNALTNGEDHATPDSSRTPVGRPLTTSRPDTPPARPTVDRANWSDMINQRVSLPVSSVREQAVRPEGPLQLKAERLIAWVRAAKSRRRQEAARNEVDIETGPGSSSAHSGDPPPCQTSKSSSDRPVIPQAVERDIFTTDHEDMVPQAQNDFDVVMDDEPASARPPSPSPITVPPTRRRSIEQQLWRGYEIPLSKGFRGAWPEIPDTPPREEDIIRCPLSQAVRKL